MRGTKLERTPGGWRLRRFTGTDPLTGDLRQATRTCHGTKKQPDSPLAEFVRDVARRDLATDASTVEEYLDRWFDRVAVSKSPTTVRGYRGGSNASTPSSAMSSCRSSPPSTSTGPTGNGLTKAFIDQRASPSRRDVRGVAAGLMRHDILTRRSHVSLVY
jgi:hypothetical protein